MWCFRIHLFMLLLPTKWIRVQELCLCLAYRIRGQPHARYKWILDGQVTWNSIGMDLWSHMSQPVWRRNQGNCGFWPIPSLMKPTNRREWAVTPQAASVASRGSERAMRCVGLLMFCWFCWHGVLAFTALSDRKTSLSRIPENLLTHYQWYAWYFYGSLCSANCIDAHYFSMWNHFPFCPSTCSKQSSCADQKDLAQLFKAASVELLSSSGVSESPRRSTNSLSFEGTEEQGLKRITSIWVCLKMGYTPNYSHLVGIHNDH